MGRQPGACACGLCMAPMHHHSNSHRQLTLTRVVPARRQVYNQMVGSPAQKTASLSIIKSVHFTNCQKPWSCNRPAGLCTLLHQEWWKMLHFMEETQKIPSQSRHGLFEDGCQGGYRPVDWDSVHPP